MQLVAGYVAIPMAIKRLTYIPLESEVTWCENIIVIISI